MLGTSNDSYLTGKLMGKLTKAAQYAVIDLNGEVCSIDPISMRVTCHKQKI